MAIVGWVVFVVIVFKITVVAFLVLLNCTGTYNIGGAVNTRSKAVKAWLFFIGVLTLWYPVFLTFPFTVSVK